MLREVKPQTRVFVCAGSSADALLVAVSSTASVQMKTPSRWSTARRKRARSEVSTSRSLAAFSRGN